MLSLKHDITADSGSYAIRPNSIFYLGESDATVWPKKKIPLKPTDIIYNKLKITISGSDTIVLYSKEEIYGFLKQLTTGSKNKIDKKLLKKYSSALALQ